MSQVRNTAIINAPFVKTFKTPNGYYFYDVNKDMVCPVDSEAYNEINRMLADGTCASDLECINVLMESGYLSPKRIEVIENGFTGNIDYLLKHNLQQLTLQVTQACNLCCIYCPYATSSEKELQRAQSNKTMDFNTAKKAIDYLAENSDQTEDIFIGFYGGEPLISWKLIQECVEYAEGVFEGKKLNFSMTTNATLLTDEMINYMYKKKFILLFSLDGPKEIHDKHRVRIDGSPTYDIVIKTLEKTVEKYGNDSKAYIGMNMVVNPADSIDDIIKWLEMPVFSKIRVQYSVVDNGQLENKFMSTQEYASKFNYLYAMALLDYLKVVDGIKKTSITSTVLENLIEDYSNLQNDEFSLPDIGSPTGPCISGVRNLFVNADGVFYPCEKANELSDWMVIGNVNDGIDSEKVKKHINIAQITPERCRNCWAQRHCDVCQKHFGDSDGEFKSGSQKNEICRSSRSLFMDKLYLCTLIKEYKTLYNNLGKEVR